MKFTKMHGCQNDFVIVNCFDERVDNPSETAIRVCDRRRGIGADGLILILPTEGADAFMQIYNADGSKDTMCGNGIRCVARYIYDHGLVSRDRKNFSIDTPAGLKHISLEAELISVDMGEPVITSELPEAITVNGRELKFFGIDTGTPHAVFFVEDNPALEKIFSWPDSKFASEGAYFETHERFPGRVTADFIETLSRGEVNMRVFERGCGETMACGTGATASVFAGFVAGKLGHEVLVHLRGGDLTVKVAEDDHCFLIGPALEIFSGEIF